MKKHLKTNIVFQLHTLTFLFLLVQCLLGGSLLNAQNLITNGDFEQGNGIGFTSNYNYITAPNSAQKNYGIVNSPISINGGFSNACVDHTSGTGKMMVVDGSFSNQDKIWEQSPGGGISIVQGKKYIFSYWIQTVSTGGNLADIEVRFNNTVLVPVSGSTVAPSSVCGWSKVTYEWTATGGTAQIWLYDKTTTAIGNDFALDDLSLTAIPDPLSINYGVINPSCPGTNDGYITVYAAGGTPPYTYSLNGGSFTSSNIFSGLGASANNFVSVQDAALPTAATVSTNPIINLTNPVNSLVVREDTTLCAGVSVTLSVSGGNTLGYTWTANPADPTLTNPSSATPTVTPATTTVYTITSNSNTNQNLIFNPGFELGNIGFISDYNYKSVLPTRDRRAYGITTSPILFDDLFIDAPDHSGTGNMMVVDGSEVNAGNDKVWSQSIPVLTNTNYTFKYWVQTAATPSPAVLETHVNGSPINGTAPASTYTCPVTAGNWQQVTYTWNSGSNTTATITIYNRNTAGVGNDFALDDFEFYSSTTCSLTKTVTVTVNDPTPKPTVTTPVTYCQNATATALTATGSNLLWYTTIDGIGSTTAPIPSTANNNSTTFYVTQNLENVCGESAKESIVVNVIATTPKPTVTTPITYCQNATATALTAIGTNLLWYTSIDGPGSTTAPIPSTANNGTTSYYVSQSSESCGVSAREKIDVTVVANPTVQAGTDTEITIGNPVTLNGSTNTTGTYLWTPSATVVNAGALSTLANPTQPTTYTLTVTNEETGCKASDDVFVNVKNVQPCVTVMPPNAFTPNNDGYYDRWNIGSQDCVLRLQVDVYNRWGSLVYHSDNYKNDWDGTYKGKPVPDATYYYIIKVFYRDNTNRMLKGNLTIIR